MNIKQVVNGYGRLNKRTRSEHQALPFKSNYTQEQLAEKIGIGPKHLSRLETAKIGISLDTLFNIADALEIEPYLLLMFH